MFCWAGFTVLLTAERTGLIRGASGKGHIRLQVDTDFAHAGASDILWVPGGSGNAVAAAQANGTFIQFLKAQAAGANWVTSVCTGALLLAAAGLLDGYEATTHWDFLPCFARYPRVKVTPGNPRFCIDRNRVTGGGISSGLDESLEIIQIVAGTVTAIQVQQTTQYYPDPPVKSQIPVATTCPVPDRPTV